MPNAIPLYLGSKKEWSLDMFVDSRCRRDEQETDRHTWNHHRCNEDHYFSCSSQGGSCLIPFLLPSRTERERVEKCEASKTKKTDRTNQRTEAERPYFVGSTYLAKGSGTSSFGPFHHHSDFALDFESDRIGFLCACLFDYS